MMAASIRTPTGQAAAALVALAVLIAIAHGGALPGAFHYDDFYSFVQNPAVKAWHPARYFTSPDAVVNTFDSASYRPLTVWSFAATYRLAGMEPWAFLMGNLGLHLAAAWLVFLIGRALLTDIRWAGVAGVAYAIHPVNAEAVNYAVSRSSLLATVFCLVSTWAFIRYVERQRGNGMLVIGLAALACALLSKESAVAVLIPLALYSRFRPAENGVPGVVARATWAAIAYAGLAAVYLGLWTYITAGGVTPTVPSIQPAWTYLEMVGRSLAWWVWPRPLGLDHPLTFLSRFDPGLAVALVGGAIGYLGGVVWLARRAPTAAWGLVWAVVGLAPLAPLPWLTTVALLQEHRMGFSAAGLSWATAALSREVWTVLGRRPAARVLRWIIAGVGVVVALLAVAVDRQRSAVWNDDRRLWAEVVRRSPDNMLARINLGSAYMMRREYPRAEAEFRAILALVPTYYKAYDNLGLVALRQNRPDEARMAFQRAADLNPQDPEAQTNLGILALRAGDPVTAEASFLAALAVNPDERDALNNLATIYLQRREWAIALDLVTRALRRNPQFLEASYHQGVALAGLGRRAEAELVLREVRPRLSPDPSFDPYRQAIDRLLSGDSP